MRTACRMFKKAVQQGGSERRGKLSIYFLTRPSLQTGICPRVLYVQPLSEGRTLLADFFNTLLGFFFLVL